MRIETGQQAGNVMAAIATAAARTGADFGLLLAQARAESGLRPAAAAAGSSARGLFQFTRATWLAMVERHGARLGLDGAAGALAEGTAAGRERVLALRDDPLASSLMAGTLAADNRALLERRLGRPVDAVEVHLAHFLGAGGAERFLRALAAAPGRAAAPVVPAAAAANRSVFFESDGRARSLAEVKALMSDRLGLGDGGITVPADGKDLPLPAPLPAPALAARWLMARLALAQLADEA